MPVKMERLERPGRQIVMLAPIVLLAVCMLGGCGTSSAAEPGETDPPDRNCWDRSTWGPRPTDVGRMPGPDPAPDPAPDRSRGDMVDTAGAPADRPVGAPVFVSADLSSNRWDGLSPGTLQVVVYYDGDESGGPALRVGYTTPSGEDGWIDVGGIHCSTSDDGRIDTFEYDLRGCAPNGRFEVRGVRPNGVIDGMAFGLFWRDDRGVHVLRSTAPEPSSRARLVGAWPLALGDRSFATRTPQLTHGYARRQARMTIAGAELLDNGRYLFAIQERAVRLRD
ncbi:MAG: hypothetical protein ACYTJ0_08325 [Planctomycetota bacterium]|jgi:hypothetical protein